MMKDNSLVLDVAGPDATERELVWLHTTLFRQAGISNAPLPITRDEYFSAVLSLLNRKHFKTLALRQSFVRSLRGECASSLLPEHNFSWVDTSNQRLCLWLWLQLSTVTIDLASQPHSSSLLTTNKARRNEIIKLIDTVNLAAFEKLFLLKDLKHKWAAISNSGFADFRWIQPKNQEQHEWALKYLLKQDAGFSSWLGQLDRVALSTYDEVLAGIDFYCWALPRNNFAEKMKLAWSQKETRQRVKKKVGDIKGKIPSKHLVMLLGISEKYGHSSAIDTLKYMIEKEHNKIKMGWGA